MKTGKLFTGRRRKKRGPVPPHGGRSRITVNLPNRLRKLVLELPGKSMSDRIVCALSRLLEESAREC